MKSFKLIIGYAEIVLALIAVFAAVTSSHPQAWFGYVLAVMFGSKGILYVLWASEVRE
jgi:xanthine/uracil permease